MHYGSQRGGRAPLQGELFLIWVRVEFLSCERVGNTSTTGGAAVKVENGFFFQGVIKCINETIKLFVQKGKYFINKASIYLSIYL